MERMIKKWKKMGVEILSNENVYTNNPKGHE